MFLSARLLSVGDAFSPDTYKLGLVLLLDVLYHHSSGLEQRQLQTA